ncbi:hypothetical protein K1719_009120 [Acacia pycnantha]|nr:hypothetical protein K1719_009120 [Acacia pycnantha]
MAKWWSKLFNTVTTKEWESKLSQLKKIPQKGVQEVLKLSYDELNDEEREKFLDIACYLKGECEQNVIRLFESYGLHASIGLRTLLDKALLTIDLFYRVEMHDLIQGMGNEIVRQQCLKEPGKRSHLWNHEEVYGILKNKKGTDAIESITFDVSQMEEVHLSSDAFKNMPNLRSLKLYYSTSPKGFVNLRSGLESFRDRLKFFYWDYFPLESLPASTFCPQSLLEIHMKHSHSLCSSSLLESLSRLSVDCCSSLEDFSLLSEKIEELDLTRTGIEINRTTQET